MRTDALMLLLEEADPASEVVCFINGKDEPITSVEMGKTHDGQQQTVLFYGEDE